MSNRLRSGQRLSLRCARYREQAVSGCRAQCRIRPENHSCRITPAVYSASIPFPGYMRKFSVSVSSSLLPSRYFTMAFPRGCSEWDSDDAVQCSISSSSISGTKLITLQTVRLPSVSVPVLSNVMQSTLPIRSNASPDFIRTPYFVA